MKIFMVLDAAASSAHFTLVGFVAFFLASGRLM